LASVLVLMLVQLVVPAVVVAAEKWETEHFDTNNDGKPDLDRRKLKENGTYTYHFDRNENGKVDSGEPVIKEIDEMKDEGEVIDGKQWRRFKMHRKDCKNAEIRFSDLDKDGKTNDPGEMVVEKAEFPIPCGGGRGGIIQLPDVEEPGVAIPDLSGHNHGTPAGIIAGAIAGATALISAAWYIRRRRTKAI